MMLIIEQLNDISHSIEMKDNKQEHEREKNRS